jgi:hypothetical protein
VVLIRGSHPFKTSFKEKGMSIPLDENKFFETSKGVENTTKKYV